MDQSWEAKRWTGKRGKAKSYFHRLCNTLDAHSNVLDVIPRGSEYTSIFAGTLTTIIKASVNHEAIAEDLTQTLCEIGEVIKSCEVDLQLFRTESMQRAVVDLYAHIFLFLNDAMCWYMKSSLKKTLDSFNEKFRDMFANSVANIRRQASVIRHIAAQGSGAELRVMKLGLLDVMQDARLGLQGHKRHEAEIQVLAQQMQLQVASKKAELQKRDAQLQKLQRSLDVLLHDAAQAVPAVLAVSTVSPVDDSSVKSIAFRDNILLQSAVMEDYFHRDRVRLNPPEVSSIKVEPLIVSRIREWMQGDTPQILAVAGPYYEGDELECAMTLLAARFIDIAAASQVPIVSYFCELRRHEELHGDNSIPEQGLVQVVYALIRQMIELLLPETHHSDDLHVIDISQLDGTMASWKETMVVFSKVESLLPGTVLCVVEGMQWLDSRRMNKYVADFVQILRGGKLKTLLISAGEVRCLSSSLRRTELLVMEDKVRVGTEVWAF
ncbi:phytanoyl- dioxygenase family protein [Stagonosporopsis vannaccii]|nr:phytanoyl- dioxygenase family protein [Stagonosporopsis vannaccii]